MFWRNTYHLGRYTEVEEYHSGRYGAPGQKRAGKREPTPEEIAKVNQRNKEKQCRRKLKKYFEAGDYFFLLTYRKEDRPASMDEAVGHFAKLIRRLRQAYKKAGLPCMWIRNIEQGTKGAWHIHLAIKAIPGERLDIIIQDLWEHGAARSEPISERKGWDSLASYLTKSEVNEKRIRSSGYSASRNMPLPEPDRKVIKYKTFQREPHVPRGWTFEQGSLAEGMNPVTGYPWRCYGYYKKTGNKREFVNRHDTGLSG